MKLCCHAMINTEDFKHYTHCLMCGNRVKEEEE